jgi:hypothetical protein
VLRRPKFGFDQDAVGALLDYIDEYGEAAASSPLAVRLPDGGDEPFLEVAFSAWADYLVTGNMAHYPANARGGVDALSPGDFVAAYRGLNATQQA